MSKPEHKNNLNGCNYAIHKLIFGLFFSLFISLKLLAQDGRIWATYYGASAQEGGFTVTTDPAGNVYMAGITASQSGMASGGFQNTFGGGNVDAYLVKFDSSGARLWATYYGGAGDEMSFFGGKMGVAADDSGNVYLAGLTNSTTGIAANGFQNTIGGTVNAYLAKFGPAGNRIWATYYGGTIGQGYSVATDAYGNVYLAGSTGSSTGISSNGFQNSIGGSTDAFLVKFDWAGTRQWATYYGGSAADEGYSVATDNNGNVFLGGFTYSTSGIASGGFQNTHGGGSIDAFLVKFDSAGIRIWATYYGGPGDEMVLFAGDIGVATDSGNNVYLAGLTNSTTGIAANGYQNTIGGNYDAFLVKFESSGGRLWATYYGGTADDKAYQVATRPGNDVLICGRTGSNTNIAAGGFYNNYGGNNDAFLVKFNTNGLRQCGTYYGGSGIDDCNSIAVDAYGNVYLAGGTENTASIASGGFQNSYGGGSFDAMLVKFTAGCMTTGNTELDSIALSVYPNPSDGLLTIEQQTIGFVSVEVYNQFGQLLLVTSFTDRRRKIDLSGWGNGIYFLRIIKNGEVITQHVIIN